MKRDGITYISELDLDRLIAEREAGSDLRRSIAEADGQWQGLGKCVGLKRYNRDGTANALWELFYGSKEEGFWLDDISAVSMKKDPDLEAERQKWVTNRKKREEKAVDYFCQACPVRQLCHMKAVLTRDDSSIHGYPTVEMKSHVRAANKTRLPQYRIVP